ncbi:hypothetical protein PR048_008001 [Dryococelus australis]|uniref:Uncharacterized protein n=1 Tax=Dryococelus australis TaxID=614101 RepID=A0ABQ9HVV5_9NEOP|nr:hypothetical protein PR048_008001 [Dryococelus australis]
MQNEWFNYGPLFRLHSEFTITEIANTGRLLPLTVKRIVHIQNDNWRFPHTKKNCMIRLFAALVDAERFKEVEH